MESGGFHGYRKLPNTSSPASYTINANMTGPKLSSSVSVPETMMNNHNHSSSSSTTAAADDNECTVREQDRFMPIANVIRIMRKILPPHAKISDDAKETIQECVSEYISFITGEANERCQREQRKTITAEDVLWAMSKLGFDDYIEPLTMYLHRYREMEGDRASMRGEPLGKRTVEPPYGAAVGLGAFVQPFHMGHPNGYFGVMGGYMREHAQDNNGGGRSSSQAEPNGQYK